VAAQAKSGNGFDHLPGDIFVACGGGPPRLRHQPHHGAVVESPVTAALIEVGAVLHEQLLEEHQSGLDFARLRLVAEGGVGQRQRQEAA
jgi:hypothetical protein